MESETKNEKLNKLIYPNLSYDITGFLYETHNNLGRYQNEKEYGDFLENIFGKSNVKFQRELSLQNNNLKNGAVRSKIDFLIEGKIVLELKCKRVLTKEDYYQTIRYLTAANKKLGLVVNFRDKYLKPRRVLNSNYK